VATRSRKLGGTVAGLVGYFAQPDIAGLEEYYRDGSGPSRDGERSRNDDDPVVFHELWGHGVDHLGVTELRRSQFADLTQGRWNGEQLTHTSYRKVVDKETGETRTESGAHTTLIDIVFAPPKSVAELLIAADPALRRGIVDDIMAATHEAWTSMEEHALVARVPVKTPSEAGRRTVTYGPRTGEESKMQGSTTKRVPAALVGLPVLQFAARPTDETIARGSPPDPHPHVHCPILPVSWQENGRTYTPDEQGIRRQAAERDAVFMGDLARRLEERGIEIAYAMDQRGRISWEWEQSERERRELFSTNGRRAHVIKRDFEAKYGRPATDGEVSQRLRATRRSKDAAAKDADTRPCWEEWRTVAERAGFPIPALERQEMDRGSATDREARLIARTFGPNGLTQGDALFDRETIRTTIARSAIGLGFTRAELGGFQDEIMADLIPVRQAKDERFDLFTTEEVVRAEIAVDLAERRKAEERHATPGRAAVANAVAQATVRLDQEQRAAVTAVCSESGWVRVVGHAGTGKTTALRTAVTAFRESGTVDNVVVICVASQTAQETGKSVGADHAWSVEAFTTAVRFGFVPTKRTLILVDEAAMVDTPRMAEFVEAAGPARIRLIGDPMQLTPIGPGGWFTDQLSRGGAVELTTVHRQKSADDVRAYTHVREGAAAKALAELIERDRVHIATDRPHAVAEVLKAYTFHRDGGREAGEVRIILEGSNQEVDTLNRMVQRDRRTRGEIEGTGIELHATAEQRRWTLHERDQVMFLETYDRDDPRIPWQRRQRKVRNGEVGTVIAIDAERSIVEVEIGPGERVKVNIDQHAATQPIGLRYAVHINRFQGGEAEIALVLPSRSPIASLNTGYTQLTRGKMQADIFLDSETHGEDPVGTLAKAWAQPVGKRSALSQLDPSVVARFTKDTGRRRPGRPAERPEPVAEQAAERQPEPVRTVPVKEQSAKQRAADLEAEELLAADIDLQPEPEPGSREWLRRTVDRAYSDPQAELERAEREREHDAEHPGMSR
jgi:hypothetical protein